MKTVNEIAWNLALSGKYQGLDLCSITGIELDLAQQMLLKASAVNWASNLGVDTSTARTMVNQVLDETDNDTSHFTFDE